MSSARLRLLFLVTEDWYFRLHRIDLARAARDEGFEVLVATRPGKDVGEIERDGFKHLPIPFVRGMPNPLTEMRTIAELIRLYRRERPDIVHHIALKPVLYGAWAAYAARVPAVVNTFAGLGYIFSSEDTKARLLRSAIARALRRPLARPNTRIIFQNGEDLDQLAEAGVIRRSLCRVIRGSGVDVSRFVPHPESEGVPMVLLASRMLWDKGVGDFVEAARILKARGLQVQCVLSGMIDGQNPAGIPERQLLAWQEEGVIQWWGFREDMPSVLARAHIVVLPTYYGEGVPKILLEAASCARPIVATDVRGCREVVQHGVNGLLVPAKDPASLASAIEILLRDPALRARMGARGREIAVREFSMNRVADETITVYRELLHESGRVAPMKEARC